MNTNFKIAEQSSSERPDLQPKQTSKTAVRKLNRSAISPVMNTNQDENRAMDQGMKTTVTCKSLRVRQGNGNIVVEIDNAAPGNLVQQLFTKDDVAALFRISIRKVEEFARSGELPIMRIGGSVRFKEADVLRLQMENQEPTLRPVVELLPAKPKAMNTTQEAVAVCSS